MSAVAELTTAYIYQLVVDPDTGLRDLIKVDEVEAPANAVVALEQFFFEKGDEYPSALYEARLPDGSRSGLIRGPGPDPMRRARSRALGAR